MDARIPLLRVLARRIEHLGVTHTTAIVDITPDRLTISITPFERETAATPYENRPLRSVQAPDGRWWLCIESKL